MSSDRTLPTLAELNDPGLFTPAALAPACTTPPKRQRPVRESVVVVLVDSGAPGDPPMDVRLANALKSLGRRFKLRVRDIKDAEAPRG